MNRLILILAAGCLSATFAFAQTAVDETVTDQSATDKTVTDETVTKEELDAVPPPPVIPQQLESGEAIEPEVTIIRDKEKLVEEYRINGRLYMVKITPKTGKPYYLVDKDGDGTMESRMSEIYNDFVVPQWVIFSW